MAIDRRLLKKGLSGAGERSYQRKDEGGSFRNYVVIPGKYSAPKVGKIAEGAFVFDILPFVVSKDFNHMYKAGQVEYVLEVWAHGNVGPSGSMVICPQGTFNKKCPICEEVERMKAAGMDWKTQIGPVAMKRRCLYNIWVHDQAKKEENKGAQVLEIAYFSLEKDIVTLSKNPITGGFIEFFDPDNGKHVCFTRQGTGKDNTKYLGYQFLERANPVIPDNILEQCVPLNEAIEILTYEELFALFHGEGGGPEAEDIQQPDVPPSGNSRVRAAATAAAEAENSAPDPSEEAAAEPEPTPPTTPPASAPAAGTGRQRRNAAPTAADPNERCPHGGKFGVDSDKIEGCKLCGIWDDCCDSFDKLNT